MHNHVQTIPLVTQLVFIQYSPIHQSLEIHLFNSLSQLKVQLSIVGHGGTQRGTMLFLWPDKKGINMQR